MDGPLYRIRSDCGIYEPGFWTLILLLLVLLITSCTLIIITLLRPYRAPYSPLLLHLRSRTRLGRSVVLTRGRSRNYVFYEKKSLTLWFVTPFYVAKFKIKHLQDCCSLMSKFEIEQGPLMVLWLKYQLCINLRNYLVNKVAVQMGQKGLVAVDLVAEVVVGAKKSM